jgi:hypothetical protein
MGDHGGVEGGWRWNGRKVSWVKMETRGFEEGHKPSRGSQRVHSSDEAVNK